MQLMSLKNYLTLVEQKKTATIYWSTPQGNQDETLLKQIQHLSSSPKKSPRYPLVEKVFERIISEGDQAINEIVCEQHNFDRQKLRQLKSNILKAKEKSENRLKIS